MRKTLHLLLVLTLLFIGGISANAQTTVTQTSFTATSGNVGGDKNVSYKAEKGKANTAPAINNGIIRVYQNGGLFTVSVADGCQINNVTLGSAMKTTVTYVTDKNTTASATKSIAANGNVSVNLSGGEKSITFTCTGTTRNDRLYVNSLSVTYKRESTGKTKTTLAFADPADKTFALNATEETNFTNVATLTPAVEGATISYSSDNENIAVVDDNGEVLVETSKAGSATITASYAGDDNHEASTASYKINIIDSSNISETTFDFTSTEGLAKLGITAPSKSSGTNLTENTEYQNSDNATVSFTVTNSNTNTRVWNSNGAYTLRVYKNGGSLTIKVANGYTLTSIAFNGDYKDATYTKYTPSATFTGAATIKTITVKYAPVVSLALNKYGYATTYYSNKALKVPAGVTATAYDEDVNAVATYDEGKVIPAGEAVILQGEANATAKFIVDKTSTATATANNALHGSDTEATTTGIGMFYLLSAKNGKVGFYWGAENGAAFTSGAHKAYLVVPETKAKPAYIFNGKTTGIKAIETETNEDDNVPAFNISGQRVNKDYKGIVIKNGKKYINK